MSSRLRRPALTSLATLAVLAGMLVTAPAANAAILTQSLGPDLTPAQLAGALVGTGVTVSNAQFTGANIAGGTFSGGGTGAGAIIGFEQGAVLSSGAIANVVGPNNADNATTSNGQPGDASLNALLPVGQSTNDAASLTFDFVPDASSVTFRYVFSSEEYNEFVGEGFNDVFAFFVNGTNCATVGGQPVSVDTINGGNPFGTNPSNASLYRNNDPDDPGPPTIDTQMDGLTTVLTCAAPVTANQTNTMKLAIADVGDFSYDSAVFIEAGSLTTEPPTDVPGAPTDVTAVPGDASATVTWTAPDSDGGSEIDGYTVTCVAGPDDVHTASTDGATSAVVSGLTNDVEYTCTVTAHNVNGDSEPSEASAPFTPTGGGEPQFSLVVDTSEGGILLINPEGPANVGTTAKIKILRSPVPARRSRSRRRCSACRRDRRDLRRERLHRAGHRVGREQPVGDQADAGEGRERSAADARRERAGRHRVQGRRARPELWAQEGPRDAVHHLEVHDLPWGVADHVPGRWERSQGKDLTSRRPDVRRPGGETPTSR